MKIDKEYKKAMERLTFSDDLEKRTVEAMTTSLKEKKEDAKGIEQVRKAPEKQMLPISFFNRRKKSIMALATAAAVLLTLFAVPVSPLYYQKMPLTATPKTEQGATEPGLKDLTNTTNGALPHPAMPAPVEMAQRDKGMEPLALTGDASYGDSLSFSAKNAGNLNWNTEEYNVIKENDFTAVLQNPLSTFSADVDTASYAKLRSSILSAEKVPADSVRIEEMINYFTYDYKKPENGEPFGVTMELAPTPWNPQTLLLQIGLQAQELDMDDLPPQNLVFLIDVSGSMDEPNKLPLVKQAFLLLLEELKEQDTVSIVTYASRDEVVIEGIPAANKTDIMEAVENLASGGATAGAAGIQTAYELAQKYYNPQGNNRVVLATDGDLNVGISDEGSLTRLIEEQKEKGVFLSVLGFGYGNYKDNKLEALADNGNGNYAYIDTIYEARKALIEEMGGTFFTVAKDVKLQVDFNPAKVKGYRLIGYENRLLNPQDFADDQKDGGEVGSGHRVTALYEIIPVGSEMEIGVPQSKYQSGTNGTALTEEWLTVNVRAKAPEGDESQLYTYPLKDEPTNVMSDNMAFASSVAEFGMLLRDSEHKGNASYAAVLERLRQTGAAKGDVYKEEFQYLVSLLARQEPNRADK